MLFMNNLINYFRTTPTLHLAFCELGGVGDCLMVLPFLVKLKEELSPNKVDIDFFCRKPEIIQSMAKWLNVFSCDKKNMENINKEKYDIVFQIIRYAIPLYIKDEKKIALMFPKLYDYINQYRKHASFFKNLFITDRYGLLLHKKRMNQIDMFSVFGYDYEKIYFNFQTSTESETILNTYGLKVNEYITVHNGVDDCYDDSHPKLYPKNLYGQLVQQLKKLYPTKRIVQIGKGNVLNKIDNIDLFLVNKTTSDEVKVLLKNSFFLLSSEGGLVHLQHLLGGMSVVLFGPTSIEVFGYKENLNITANACAGCCNIDGCWSKKCINSTHICMTNLKPEYIIERLKTDILI